jgi:hypothetical protein
LIEVTAQQKSFLNDRFCEAAEQQPEIRALRRILLRIGGVQLVAPPNHDSILPTLIEAGFTMSTPSARKPMRPGTCHVNISSLWMRRLRDIVGIGTGYALSADGLWRQHSWGVRRQGILETTALREKYFGILLQGSDADSFADANLNSNASVPFRRMERNPDAIPWRDAAATP